MVSHLARALNVTVTELLEGYPTPPGLISDSSSFLAFCPDPLCITNKTGRNNDGTVFVRWTSGNQYPIAHFDQVNFCERCGEGLVKECPSCRKPVTRPNTKYCITCGTQIVARPTIEEWEMIRALYPDPEPSSDDDLPF